MDVLFAPTAPGQVTNVTRHGGQRVGDGQLDRAVGRWSHELHRDPVYRVHGPVADNHQLGAPPATNATINGLTAGTAYTFTVQASNANGTGPVSAHSNSVTPTGAVAPSAPTGVSASPATGQAQVSWTAPANGGSPITGYTVTPYIGDHGADARPGRSGSATAATVTGLTNGTAYTFTVAATNARRHRPGLHGIQRRDP